MKILHLLSQRPDSTGSGFYVQAIIREAAAAGHENYLLAGVDTDCRVNTDQTPVSRCFFTRFNGEDLPYAIPGMSDVMPYPSTRFMDLTFHELDMYKTCFAEKIRSAVNQVQPDIIHSNHLWVMTALTAAMNPKIPLAASCHGTDLRQFKNCTHLQPWIRENCSRINHIFALSRTQKAEISQLYQIPEKKITCAGVGFNEDVFSWSEKPEPPPVNLVYAGKLSRAKGVIWLLESLEEIMDLPFHLYLAGSGTGPEKEACIKLAKQLSPRVTLCGALSQTALAQVMKRSHLFILPSFFEGLPLVLFEALASGCRIITTALDGAKELLEHAPENVARLLELPVLETIDAPFSADMPGLKQQLAEILSDEIKQVSAHPGVDQKIVEHLIRHYTWQGVYKRLEPVYKRLTRDY